METSTIVRESARTHGGRPPRQAPPVPPPTHDEDVLPRPEDLPRPRRVTMILAAAGLLVTLGLMFALGWIPRERQRAKVEQEAAAVVNDAPAVNVEKPQKSPVSSELDLPGNVQAMQETGLYARTTGYLKRWLVDIGDRVQAGQLLAEIDTPEVDADLLAARAALDQARANVSKSQTDLQFASSTLARFKSLIGTSGVTQQEIDQYQSNYDSARTNLLAMQAAVAADEANVKKLTDMQSWEKVIAPFAGTITARNVDVGALIQANAAGTGNKELFHLAQVDPLRVFVSVPQAYSPAVHTGQRGALIVREYPGRSFEGKVVRTAGAIDPTSRTLMTEIQVPNTDFTLMPGMYAQVHFDVTESSNPMLIPASALIADEHGVQVAVVKDNVAHFQKVQLGRDFGATVEITAGLSEDDPVVTNPGERLTDNGAVTIAKATDQPASQP